MTVDIEKLKALALAPMRATTAIKAEQALADFRDEASPATVLALIAEVERLRAELAAGAARQGGNTSGNPGPETGVKTAETRMVSGSDGGPQVAAPASGAEKDAKRWRAFRDRDNAPFPGLFADAFFNKFREDADEVIDAAIAHTKARDA